MTSVLFLCLIGVVEGAITAALITALLYLWPSSVSPPTNESTPKPLMCTTDDCKVLAQWLRVKLDQKFDPCDDFYQFVCDDYQGIDTVSKITDDVMKAALSAARASTAIPSTGQTAWQKATALFKACVTMFYSKRDETKELTAWMTSLGLDLNNLTSSDPFDPVDMVVRLSLDFGLPVLLTFTFADVAFGNKRLMVLQTNDADASWSEYRQKTLSTSPANINDFYLRMLQKYGVDNETIQGLSSEISKYETRLSAIHESARRVTGQVHGPIKDIGALTEPLITGEMWVGTIAKYTKNMYGGNDIITYQKLVPVFLVKALDSKYVGLHGIRCCMAWSLFRQLVYYADPGQLPKHRNPESVCYRHANWLMGYAITSRFYHSVISKKSLMEVNEIVSNTRKAFQAAFQSLKWMTGSVRETALRKIMTMRHHIGAVGALPDSAYVEKYYASFPDLPTNRFFKGWREAAAAAIRQAWADTTMLLHMETEANGFYTPVFNTMVISASMLLPDIFFTEGPAAFNYGSLGRVLRPRQEAPNDTIDSEILADLGGTPMAYSAFTSLPPSRRDTTLPGVAMTANQLFFVGHCTAWCEKQTTEPPPWLSGNAIYPPGRSRCIVPLMNMPEFSAAFHCKKGSYMNPAKKCSFWS
ncbi:endothelin-converting enzyme 1-like isoform X2 [Dermacentor andersoni]|uniref:endothelin-converting enzyme 1-like isoform X2 n=1 Tax=Dermacentor andersoni TaxID=34620 RepID=UPI00241673FF|nr:membrane metallo-endopeptidase-like 1 isoform X2 [Dermacentor andersoni]